MAKTTTKKKRRINPVPPPARRPGATLADILSAIMSAQKPRLTQQDVADGCGVSRVTVSYWQNGQRAGSQGALLRLWNYLKTFDPELKLQDLMTEGATR